MKLLYRLCASWGLTIDLGGKLLPGKKTCVSIQNKCLENIWPLNKLRPSIFGQEFTLRRTLHQTLPVWRKALLNANVHSQTWFWKLWSFHMSTHVLLEDSLSWLAFLKKRQKTKTPEQLLILSEVDNVLSEGKVVLEGCRVGVRRTVTCAIAMF